MKISKNTIIRTVVLIVALINQILTSAGKNPLPFAEETIYEIVTYAFTVGAAVWSWWKNNSITQEAMRADEYLKELKNNK